MAKKVDKFDFDKKSKYPWDEWFDGDIWVLEQGEDFTISLPNMRSVIYGAADRAGLEVKTSVDADAKTITIQASK
jgi:hypothetical protein